MLSEFFRFGRVLLVAGFCLFLVGCTADRYFMVQKQDMDNLNNTLLDQQHVLKSLDTHSRENLENLIRQTETNRTAILEAIEEKVQQPSCPPVPEQTSCTAESGGSSDSDADRLKGKLVVGELEKFYLVDPGLIYDARIDSGAETSSLDARNITRFERDGQNWVRFDVPDPEGEEMVTLEREVSRRVRIIQSSVDESERRVVVELQFMIGDHRQQAEFTLTDRQHLSQRVLVGRNILRDVMLVEVGKEFSTELSGSPVGGTDNP